MECLVTGTPAVKNPVTGEMDYSTHKAADPNVINANNDCKYFKQRWFKPKLEKKYCCNCKLWHTSDWGM